VIAPEMREASVRDAVRDALPIPLLADLIRTISVSVSELDGAGEAGYLSPIQCTQVAVLMHDATIDFVVGRFGGDVTRFKAALAVMVILLSKGTIHARAVRGKLSQRRAARIAAATAELAQPETGDYVPAGYSANGNGNGMSDVYAAALRRQQAMIQEGRAE
jgi:hypothetical protein